VENSGLKWSAGIPGAPLVLGVVEQMFLGQYEHTIAITKDGPIILTEQVE